LSFNFLFSFLKVADTGIPVKTRLIAGNFRNFDMAQQQNTRQSTGNTNIAGHCIISILLVKFELENNRASRFVLLWSNPNNEN